MNEHVFENVHEDGCAVTRERGEVLAILRATESFSGPEVERMRAVYLGALREYDGHGDQEVENCTCSTTVAVEIPYELTTGTLHMEAGPDDWAGESLHWLAAEWDTARADDAEVERILRGAVTAHAVTGRAIGECLRTAIVWERG